MLLAWNVIQKSVVAYTTLFMAYLQVCILSNVLICFVCFTTFIHIHWGHA